MGLTLLLLRHTYFSIYKNFEAVQFDHDRYICEQ